MANIHFSQKRQIYDEEDTENNVVNKNVGGAKTNKKPKEERQLGGSLGPALGKSFSPQEDSNLPDIKKVENYVLQSIIGQDDQVKNRKDRNNKTNC